MSNQTTIRRWLLASLLFAFIFIKAQITINPNVTPACAAGSGAVTFNISGASAGSYTYYLYGPTVSQTSTTPTFGGLNVGSYDFMMTGADSAYIHFTVPSVISYSAVVSNTTCNANNGQIALSVSGGTAPYTYSWSNGATTPTISNLPSGNKDCIVSDANGCQLTLNENVNQAALNATIVASGTPCNPIYTASMAGGVVPFTYNWGHINIGSNYYTWDSVNTANISNIYAYNVIIEITDALGCVGRDTLLTQGVHSLLDSASISTNNPTSCNNSNGSISISNLQGTAPYIFLWSNGAITSFISNLAAGNYLLTVTDANGCSASQSFNLYNSTQISAYISVEATPTCGSSNGILITNTYGGSAPYSYQWTNNVSTTDTAKNLTAGNYAVTITDVNACSAVFTQVLRTHLQLTPSITPACTNSNGAVTFSYTCSTVSQLNYELYSIDLNFSYSPQTSNTFTNLPVGNYYLRAISALDSAFLYFIIPYTIQTNATITNASCHGNDGGISLTPNGGVAPYSFLWSNGATTSSISNLAPSNYLVTVTDANGCTLTKQFYLGNFNIILDSSSVSVLNPTRCNATNGSISVSNLQGTAPYTFSWSNGATTSYISNLTAGNYSVTVTDANGCSASQSFNLYNSTQISAYISVEATPTCGSSDGVLAVEVYGGLAPYTYQWTNNMSTNDTLKNLSSGIYGVTVTDVNGCRVASSTGLNSNILFTSVVTPACYGNTGAVTFNTSCSNASILNYELYSYSSYTQYPLQTSNTFTNLPAGNYVVSVKNGLDTGYLNFNIPSTIQTNATITNAHCPQNNGSISLSPSGGAAPYTFLWNNNATTSSISNLAIGNYAVLVKDANGCSDSLSFFIHCDSVNTPSCHAQFSIYPDSTTPHVWNVYNTSSSPNALTYTWIWGDGTTSTGVAPTHSYTTSGYYNICLEITDGAGCTDRFCDSSTYVYKTDQLISVNVVNRTQTGATGINTLPTANLSIYPNPSNGIFTVSISSEMNMTENTLEVYNLLGDLVKSTPLFAVKTSLDLTHEADGVYFVKVKGANATNTFKVIKE